MDIKAFIFDLDGVITDTAELHFLSWKRLADEEHIPFTREDNDHLRGISRRDSLMRILKDRVLDEATLEAWMERKNGYYRDALTQLTPENVLPGVMRFLTQAREAGVLIGLGSASKNARDVLKALDLADLFNAVGDGHSVVNPKPAPDLFVWVAGRLGVAPPEAVVFEDAEAGIEAALRGGFYAVGIGSANVAKANLVITNLDSVSPTVVMARLKSGQGQTTRA